MENQNSVCFIAKINEVKAIEGADNIELVVAGGWNAITKKGEFKEGDETIIATTDAVIPEKLSEEIGVTNYLRKGNRVRTVKLRGVYSECLIIPMKHLSGKTTMGDWDLKAGSDCMGFLGITKYEPPVKQIQLASGRKIKYKDKYLNSLYYPSDRSVVVVVVGEIVVVVVVGDSLCSLGNEPFFPENPTSKTLAVSIG
jgi:hypothetical protein